MRKYPWDRGAESPSRGDAGCGPRRRIGVKNAAMKSAKTIHKRPPPPPERDRNAAKVCGDVAARVGDEESDPKLREQAARALVSKGILLSEIGRKEEALAVFNDVIAQFEESGGPFNDVSEWFGEGCGADGGSCGVSCVVAIALFEKAHLWNEPGTPGYYKVVPLLNEIGRRFGEGAVQKLAELKYGLTYRRLFNPEEPETERERQAKYDAARSEYAASAISVANAAAGLPDNRRARRARTLLACT
jgi:hypothetical protein